MIERLELGAIHFAKVFFCFSRRRLIPPEAGVGAAGGLGFACRAFLGAELKSGIETVLELCGFDSLANKASLL